MGFKETFNGKVGDAEVAIWRFYHEDEKPVAGLASVVWVDNITEENMDEIMALLREAWTEKVEDVSEKAA